MSFKPTVSSRLDRIRLIGVRIRPRENEVLSLVLQGKTNDVIATVMGISEWTVKGYVSRLMAKTNTRGRTHLACTHYLEKVAALERTILAQRKQIEGLQRQITYTRSSRETKN